LALMLALAMEFPRFVSAEHRDVQRLCLVLLVAVFLRPLRKKSSAGVATYFGAKKTRRPDASWEAARRSPIQTVAS
jgi:hypothetical protein